jgi:hypothetical protein
MEFSSMKTAEDVEDELDLLPQDGEYCDQKRAEQQTRDNHHVLHRCWPNAGIELRRMALSNKEQEKRIVVPYFKQFSSAFPGDLKHCYEQAY